jgi:hypothetical protein
MAQMMPEQVGAMQTVLVYTKCAFVGAMNEILIQSKCKV